MSPTPGRRGERRSRGRRLAPMALAGWLFADLLLMLALISMSGQPDPLATAGSSPSPTPTTPSPTPTPTGSEEPPSGPPVVDPERKKFRVAGANRADFVREIRRRTERWKGRRAAFVLTFGGELGGYPGSGNAFAARVNAALHEARPGMFTKEIAAEDFHDTSEPAGTAVLWVYFYTSPE